MGHEIASKSIDGITDLVVVAPIRQGFIDAYENVTYATRLRIVAEALNRVRIAAREHETIAPFSDVTERILTLLDFRVGIIDKDLFALPDAPDRPTQPAPHEKGDGCGVRDAGGGPESRRFLYLTATFDGAWEPYMRLIWDPLGPFLDLLFCNCEGYVTASEHGFDEYARWVRDNQMDSAIFYATTGLTVRDHLYLNRLEQLQRAGPPFGAREAAALTMLDPEEAAAAERAKARTDLTQYRRIHELALEALTVLYRLADYYPPEWLLPASWKFPDQAQKPRPLSEGQYLVRASASLLLGWDELIPAGGFPEPLRSIYKDPLEWYASGRAYLRKRDAERAQAEEVDPPFDPSEVQGGILKPQASREAPIREGALLLLTVGDARRARRFLAALLDSGHVHFAEGAGASPADGFYRTIALTADGLRRLGLDNDVIDWFPREFREGMEARSGLFGDMRENHPRKWRLPARNWPSAGTDDPAMLKSTPIDTSEIDIVVQIRTADTRREALMGEIVRFANAADPGLVLLGYEMLHSEYDAAGALIDHFGFHDGISQPKPKPDLPDGPRNPDEVRLGELLLGYRNDRGDFAPRPFASIQPWRRRNQAQAQALQRNGTFLVIRKLEQNVEKFEAFIEAATARINADHPRLPEPMTPQRLKARMFGRWPDGTPLIPSRDGSNNGFDYQQDRDGRQCPLAAHARRVNPRDRFQGRPTPRLVRRGMSFDHRDCTVGGGGGRGLMFMAYNASIAEQFETIQRWINGGNSTAIASAHNDPVLGVAPRSNALHPVRRVFRFVEGPEVIHLEMPDPFVSLHWGLYLFVPSRTALREKLCTLTGGYRALREMRETGGRAVIRRLNRIGNREAAREWKRLIEDIDAKDPAAQRDISPDLWSAIRWYHGGSYRVGGGVSRSEAKPEPADTPPPTHLLPVAGPVHANRSDRLWRRVELVQLRRRRPCKSD